MEKMNFIRPLEIRKYLSSIHQLTHTSYPEFISHGQVSRNYWDQIFETFPEYQRVLVANQEVVAVGNSIPVYVEDYSSFGEKGWDWALQTGIEQNKSSIEPNVLVGLSISVAEPYRGQNLSSTVLQEFKQVARLAGFSKVLIPIRPTRKHEFPEMSFDDYIEKKLDNSSFDPWIRVHERIGGRRICISRSSMRIEGTLEDWVHWTGNEFTSNGHYYIAGGLAPLVINLDIDHGRYVEPNLWIEHVVSEN